LGAEFGATAALRAAAVPVGFAGTVPRGFPAVFAVVGVDFAVVCGTVFAAVFAAVFRAVFAAVGAAAAGPVAGAPEACRGARPADPRAPTFRCRPRLATAAIVQDRAQLLTLFSRDARPVGSETVTGRDV
jgi:hypothetical protein